jgi:tetratricopeptide (TPR) repeat protein
MTRALNGRGATLNSLERFDEALLDLNEAITMAVAQTPPLVEIQAIAHQNRALSFRGLGRNQAGLVELETALGFFVAMGDPDDPATDPEVVRSIGAILATMVYILLMEKRGDQALIQATPLIGLYQKLLTTKPKPELFDQLAGAYNHRGAAFMLLNRYDDAEDDFSQSIDLYRRLVNLSGWLRLEKNLASAFQNRGSARRHQGKLDEAQADLEHARSIYHRLIVRRNYTELERGEALALSTLAEIRRDSGDWVGAAEMFIRSLELRGRAGGRADTEQVRTVQLREDASIYGRMALD